DTPHFSCSILDSWAASSRVSLSSCSAISSIVGIVSPPWWTGLIGPGTGARASSRAGPCQDSPHPDLERTPISSRAYGPLRGCSRTFAALGQDVGQFPLRSRQQPDELGERTLNGADDLAAQGLLRRQVGQCAELGRRQDLPLDVADLDGQGLI